MKKIYVYEFDVPVKETWVMRVEATSRAEAIQRINYGHATREQLSSQGGWPSTPKANETSKPVLRRRTLVRGEGK